MGIAGDFINTDPKPTWADDERLKGLQDLIDLISNVHIKALVSYMLSKSDIFWKAPISGDLEDASYPPDEYEEGGMVRNTRRATKAFCYLHYCMGFSLDEYHCAIAALLLRNITKAFYVGEDMTAIVYDPHHLYTVDGFLQMILDDTSNNYEDNGRVLGVEDEHLSLIMRLIRTSDGIMSLIPETFPVTPLEQTVHIATLMGRACHELLTAVNEPIHG